MLGLLILPHLCIDLLSLPNTVYSHTLSSQCVVCFQNVLFESHAAYQPSLHVSPISPHIFYLMLQYCISRLVDWYSCDICCCGKYKCDPCGPKAS
jgi:hypothetical protein